MATPGGNARRWPVLNIPQVATPNSNKLKLSSFFILVFISNYNLNLFLLLCVYLHKEII